MDDITNLKPEDLEKLTAFVAACRAKPELLQLPQFAFFRDYLAHMGANLTDGNRGHRAPIPPKSKKAPEPKPEDPPEEEEIESEVELNNEGVIDPETQDLPELGDADKEVSEEDMDAANEKRSEAMCAMSDGDFQKSVDLFTLAIKLNPGSAMFYAKRACALLKQERVNAAIRDCNEALKLNPDSAVAFKFRGRANRLLGNWLEAAKDLRLACKLDFDEQSDEWLKEVIPNATKLEEHNRKYERLRKEKEIREKKERIRLAQEAAKKAQEEQKKQGFSASGGVPGGFPGFPGGFPGGMPGGFPGGFPGGMPGGMPAGMFGEDGPPTGRGKPGPSAGPFGESGGTPGGEIPDFSEIFKDPEIMTAMQDPEVAAAFQDVSSNPGNIFKYQSNPKIAGVINKVLTKMGGPAPPGGERPDTEGSNNSTPYNDDLD